MRRHVVRIGCESVQGGSSVGWRSRRYILFRTGNRMINNEMRSLPMTSFIFAVSLQVRNTL